MSAEIADRLRELAHEHHEGRLDLMAYRALRGPLLDSLASNAPVAPAMEITQPRVAHRQMHRDSITRPGRPRVPGDTSAAPTSSEPTSSGPKPPFLSSRRLRQIAIFIAMAIAVVIAGVVWIWVSHSSAGRNGADGTGVGPGAVAPAPGAIKSALEQFMDAGDWSEDRLTTLNATLLELGGEQIAIVAHDPWFQHFVDELRRRLKEQQALSPTTLTVNNSPLAALAVTVGLDLNSPDSALHISALPPATPATPATPAGAASFGGAQAPTRANAGTAGQPAASQPAAGQPAASQPRTTEHSNTAATQAPGAESQAQLATASGSAVVGANFAANPAASPAADPAVANANRAANPNRAANANEAANTYLNGAASANNACRPELIHSRRPLCHDTLPTGAEAPLMALIPAGAFDMGSTAAPEEQPVHHVTLGEAFAVSVYEVSQAEFKQFCDSTHRQCAAQPWQGDDYPVVNVSWDDARAYTEWLSSVTHHRYSLPTESQWEYAARAGNTGPYPSGTALSPTDAYFSMQKKQTDAARRSQKFNANAFRLVHTLGNVREWVEDPWSSTFAGAPSDGTATKSTKPAMRVVRGGSYTDGSARLRLSMREGLAPDTRDVTTGFRIVRELP